MPIPSNALGPIEDGYPATEQLTAPWPKTPAAGITKALYIGTAGDLQVTMANGEQVTFENVQAGSTLKLRVLSIDAATTVVTVLAHN